MEQTQTKIIIIGICFFEILFYSLILAFFGSYIALICLGCDVAVYGWLSLFMDNSTRFKK